MDSEDLKEALRELLGDIEDKISRDSQKLFSGSCANIEQYRSTTGRLEAFNHVYEQLKSILK